MPSLGFLRKQPELGGLLNRIMSKTVLITGATGFIGTALVERLSKSKIKIIAVYRRSKKSKRIIKSNRITYLKLDLNKKSDLKKIKSKIDIVVHLASKVFEANKKRPLEDFLNDSVSSTYNLLEFCKQRKIKRIIYLSTKYVYGQPEKQAVDENIFSLPSGRFFSYGMSKLIGEYLCRRYGHDYGLKVTILRLSPVFGPGQGSSFLIPRLIKKAQNGEEIELYGNGMNIMDYLYIDDCLQAISLSLKRSCEGVYNIGYGRPLTLKAIINEITRRFSNHKSVSVRYLPKQSSNNEKSFVMNISKARKKLGFNPAHTFKQGLRRLKTELSK